MFFIAKYKNILQTFMFGVMLDHVTSAISTATNLFYWTTFKILIVKKGLLDWRDKSAAKLKGPDKLSGD